MLKLYRPANAGFGGQNVHSWDHTWDGTSLEEALRWAETCHLRPVFDRVFAKEGPILEGGCGIGQFVLAYHRRGYRIEGVDFSQATIERLRAWHPELPVRVGDVTALPYPDGHFQAYYSGGVVEHFEEGPFRALAEARRVLAPGGRLVITVPFLNPIRQAASRAGGALFPQTRAVRRRSFAVEPPPNGRWQFSEYYFTQAEFAALLRQAGFTILEGRPFDVEWGEICQAVHRMARGSNGAAAPHGAVPAAPAASSSNGSSRLARIWKRWFVSEDRSTPARRLALDALAACSGHMLLFVCEPSR